MNFEPQVADDILDVTQSTEKLGKTAGKDLDSDKTTCDACYARTVPIHFAPSIDCYSCAEQCSPGKGSHS